MRELRWMGAGALVTVLVLGWLSRPSRDALEGRVKVPPSTTPEDLEVRLRRFECDWWEEEGLVPPPV